MRSFLLSLTFLTFSVFSWAQSASLDSLLSTYGGNGPGISVLVIHHGKPVYKKSFGMADVEKGVKATPATNYRLASFSKQFTAMCIMMLEEKGKLSLQDPLTKYFPAFPSWAKSITIQHLLTHTSGIADYEALMPDTTTVPLLDAGAVELLQHGDSVYFRPGEKNAYSNSAYVLLGVIVEKVSGQSFPDFVATHIYKPLGMRASSMNSLQAVISNRAYGYTIRKDSVVRTDQSTTSYTRGDGAVYSSLNDLFLWDQALYANKLVKGATLKRIYTAQPGTAGIEGASGYGYGWFIHEKGDATWVSHSGGTRGFSTWIERHPAQQFSIIILVNRSGVNMNKLGEKVRALYGF